MARGQKIIVTPPELQYNINESKRKQIVTKERSLVRQANSGTCLSYPRIAANSIPLA
ncbi:Uncharacterised protein [Chlamydia abortus]|nr:Uncharacterised protein [Chlamydia abortus]